MSELLAGLIWFGVVLHVVLWFKTPHQVIAARAALISVTARNRVATAQLDLMAGRVDAAANELDRVAGEIDDVLSELEEACLEAENGFTAEAICRIERLLSPARAAA